MTIKPTTSTEASWRDRYRIKMSFDAVISTWDEQIPCEVTTTHGSQCKRAAAWRVDMHGCMRRLMCHQHQKSFMQKVARAFRSPDSSDRRCTLCGTTFETISAAYEVAAL